MPPIPRSTWYFMTDPTEQQKNVAVKSKWVEQLDVINVIISAHCTMILFAFHTIWNFKSNIWKLSVAKSVTEWALDQCL